MSDPTDRPAASKPHVSLVESPPTSILGTLSRLGPGLIIAGSIVGSGELIGTTSTGGKAGYWLLWLILIGCVIKVFVQVEFGRFSIITGKTTMEGLNDIPGPRLGRLGNWLIWYWFIMFLSSLGQLGGIVGGVGQAMAISVPLSQEGRDYNQLMERKTQWEVTQAEVRLRESEASPDPERIARLRKKADTILAAMQEGAKSNENYQLIFNLWGAETKLARLRQLTPAPEKDLSAASAELKALKTTLEKVGYDVGDDRRWAWILTVGTSILLVLGRYRFIETVTTILVAGFTFVTVVNVGLLQLDPIWHMTWQDFVNGMSFRLPPANSSGGMSALATALATFGIIGVGTNELLAYPYFCIEKGYARFSGPRDETEGWGMRARGWMRVMRVDAWCSMVVYTFATVAFYILGAAILNPIGLDPKGTEMIRTLAVMYEPIFGAWAPILFLVGAFAVLYSTFFVANAGHSRVCADVVRVLSHGSIGEKGFHRGVRIFSGVLPFICLFVYLVFPEPRTLVLVSGFMQNLMLPMLAGGAIYFRYYRGDVRVRPTTLWDVFLWISAFGLLIVACWALYEFPEKLIKTITAS